MLRSGNCKNVSRLVRSSSNYFELIRLFNKYDVELISLDDGGIIDVSREIEFVDAILRFASAR